MTRHETEDARALAEAIDACIAGQPLPPHRPTDLDALTCLLIAHADTVRAAAHSAEIIAPRRTRYGARFVVAAIALFALGLAATIRPLPIRLPGAGRFVAQEFVAASPNPVETSAGGIGASAFTTQFTSADCATNFYDLLTLDNRQIIAHGVYYYLHARETAQGSVELWADTLPTNTNPVKGYNQLPPSVLTYVVADFQYQCRRAADARAAVPVTPAATGSIAPGARYKVTNTDGNGANLRERPDRMANILLVLPEGTEVQTTGQTATDAMGTLWYVVQAGATAGYVRADLLVPTKT